ncbi:MAG: NOP58 family protein [Candidatus Micrarchaeota archaeon]|nr:NOP58 family protein [Candidatus Micrarchaeota archaeon]
MAVSSVREEFIKKAKLKVQDAISSPDLLLIHTVSAIDELNRVSNLLFERLVEWYGVYFPEFKTNDPAKFVQGVLVIDRENLDQKEIEMAFGQQAQSIIQKAKSSIGAKLSQEDLKQIRQLAAQLQLLWKLRDEIEKYQEALANKICPNMAYVAGPSLAAKLVAQAGGLKRLVLLPSSTIQVLGAEKALFKHLKTGSKPPKHGLIFQHPLISKSPRKLRGKLARALAAKIAIACKADAITGNFIAEKLKAKLDAQMKRILQKE